MRSKDEKEAEEREEEEGKEKKGGRGGGGIRIRMPVGTGVEIETSRDLSVRTAHLRMTGPWVSPASGPRKPNPEKELLNCSRLKHQRNEQSLAVPLDGGFPRWAETLGLSPRLSPVPSCHHCEQGG